MKFWEHDAYQIARKITSNHELSGDLVGHVFILMHRFNFNDADIPAIFSRFAWNQWTWKRSEFWRLYRSDGDAINDVVDVNESPSENKFSEKLAEFLEQSGSTDQENFIKEITKMHLCGMTFREIKELTGISLDTIHKTIKQFKNDLHDYCGRDCAGVHDI
jgi:DNA-directed RNA polymerase specialized sigma24 family protein